MFKISYSPNLKWEVVISWSKNAALPIVAANYCIDNKIKLLNKPNIIDVNNMEIAANEAIKKSNDYLDLTGSIVNSFRASILLIPFWLLKYGKVKFIGSGGCVIGKRPLDTFDDALIKAGITITNDEFKTFEVTGQPKKNIMLQEFAVTAVEALITYLAFAKNYDYSITVYQVATEPHVKNLIAFLNQAGADITMWLDHTLIINPSKKEITNNEFSIISDYIEAGTYFAIGAWADNAELTIKNINVDNLSSMYSLAEKIWINFKIIDKKTLYVNSFNKKNYKWVKLQTLIYPWFPTDLQSIFGTLLSQAQGISKIQETLFEWRFWYLSELENLWADTEILNPHQAFIIGPTKLKGSSVSSKDLRCGAAMVLAWIMAEWDTYIMNEEIIARGYENIIKKLSNIGVNISNTKQC